MIEPIFWMCVGGAIVGIVQHLRHNKKFAEAFNEEKAKAQKKYNAVKEGLSK